MTDPKKPPANSQSAFNLSQQDDPRVIREQTREEYTNHVVPLTARLARGNIFASWSSVASAMAFVYYGALAATLVGVQQAIIGIAVSCLLYWLIAAAGGMKAIVTGLNSTLLSREIFGVRGAAICPLIIALGGIFYAVFESSVLAAALQAFFGVGDIRLWYVVVTVCLFPLMIGGLQTWLGKLNGISLPIYFFGMIAAVIAAGARFGWDGDWTTFDVTNESVLPGWLTIVVLYMGVWILFPELQDAARFAKRRDTVFHLNVTFGIVFWTVAYLFNGIVGILIVALAAGQPGVSATEIGAVQGVVASLGVVGLLVIIVSQTRINTANFYFASTSAERFFAHFGLTKVSRRWWVLILNLIVLAVMFTNVFSYVTIALAWLGVLVTSWVGMQLVSWIFHRGKSIEFRASRLPQLAPGFYVWVVSTVAGVLLIELPSTPPVLSETAPIVSFVIAVVGYAVTLAIRPRKDESTRHDEVREQVNDLLGSRVRCDRCERSYVAIEMDRTRSGEVMCLSCQRI